MIMPARRTQPFLIGIAIVGALGVLGGRAIQSWSNRASGSGVSRTARTGESTMEPAAKTKTAAAAAFCPTPGRQSSAPSWTTVPANTSTYVHSHPMYDVIHATPAEETKLQSNFKHTQDVVRSARDELKQGRISREQFEASLTETDAQSDQEIVRILGPERGRKLIELLEQQGEQLAGSPLPGEQVPP